MERGRAMRDTSLSVLCTTCGLRRRARVPAAPGSALPFPPDYDGDEDGYAWVESFRPIAAQIVQAAAAAVKAHPGWRVRFGNRGRPDR